MWQIFSEFVDHGILTLYYFINATSALFSNWGKSGTFWRNESFAVLKPFYQNKCIWSQYVCGECILHIVILELAKFSKMLKFMYLCPYSPLAAEQEDVGLRWEKH